MVPEGWVERKIKQLGRVVTGSTPNTGDPEFYGGDIPFVSPGDLGTSRIVHSSASTLTSKGLSVTRAIPPNSIMFTCIGSTIGKVGISGKEVGTNQQINSIIANKDTDYEFLYYQLLRLAPRIKLIAGTQAIPIINKGEFQKQKLCLPISLKEQRYIAKILSTWDRAIETAEKLIANSQTQKKALMHQLLIGKKRLPGFEGEWKSVYFNTVFERVREKNQELNENILTISAQHGLVSQTKYFNKSVAGKNVSGYTLLKRGDFAYNKSYSAGYPMGAIKPLELYDKGIVSSLYICFRICDNQAHHDFYRHYFEGGYFNREIYGIAQEGARNHGLLNVSMTDFFFTRIVAPDFQEQKAIADAINIAEQEVAKFEEYCRDLKSEKAALMQQLLTGKRRVKVEDATA